MGNVNIGKLLSYDIVGNPGFISARFSGVIENERISRIKNILSKINKFKTYGIY